MSNYKRKEVFDYLTRKPVTTQDIELARTRVQPLAARIEQPETDYQTEVQPDMVVPPQDILPKNPEPVMPSAPGIPNPQFRQIELAEGGRAEFADGTRLSFEEKQKTLKDIKKYVDKKLSKKEIVTLSELNEKFGQGQRKEYLYREALGKNYDKITKLQREGVGRVSLEVKGKLYSIIDDVVKGKRPLIDLSRNNLNKELPPVSERQLSKYLNENKKYKDYNLASNVDKVQQRIAKGNEKLKDATLKNIESKLEQTTANLRRPSPKRIEEFIVRDLVRHDNQGGELFKVLPKSNTKFYDKIRILDVANDDVLTTKNIKNLVDMGDPRFKEYKETFDEIKQLKKTPYINPVTKEETNLLNALQQATGNKQPLNIDHLEGVKDNPLNKLAVSTYKANTGANIKDITEEELNILGRKKFTPEQNIERLTKFTDRRLLQEAASGFEKVKTPLETLAQKTEPSLAARMSNQLGFGPSGMIDVGEEVIEDVKGIYGKYAPKIAKGALTGLQIIGTPLASSIFYGTDVGMELKQAADEGNLTAKKAVDAFVGQGEKGLYFLLPELAKDVVTNPIANKILQLGSLGRFATPVGLGLSAVGVGKDFYDQYKEFQALPPEEKEKRIKESTYTPTEQDFQMMQEAESRASAATGGRIGYADGSDDPESDLYIPPLNEKEISETNILKEGKKEKEGIDGLYFRTREEQRPIPVDPTTGKPISSGGMRELKQVFSSLLSDTRPEVGYRKGNIDFYASKGINPFQGDTDFKYGASYTPEGNVGKFMIDKTPQYLGAGYNYQKDGLDFGITGIKDKMGDKSISLRFGYNYATGGRAGFKDGPSDPSKRKFIKGAGIVGAVGVASKFIPDLFQAAKKTKIIPKKAPFVNIVKPFGATETKFPEWFPSLVNRLRKEGDTKPIYATEEIPLTKEQYLKLKEKGTDRIYDRYTGFTENYVNELKQKGVPQHYQIKDTDEIIGYEYIDKNLPDVKAVEYGGQEMNVYFKNNYGQSVEIQYVSPGTKTKEGQFAVADARPEPGSYYDSAPDFEQVYVTDIDEVLGGSGKVEQYATKAKTPRYTKGAAEVDEAEGRALSEIDRLKDEGLIDD
jgi:hypothetical protein